MTVAASRSRVAWPIALGLYCAAIFAASSMSRPPGLEEASKHFSDKVIHATAFFGMAILAIQTARARWPKRTLAANVLVGVFFTALFGISDEVHQHFTPGRAAEVLDAVADSIGACLAAGVIYALARGRRPVQRRGE